LGWQLRQKIVSTDRYRKAQKEMAFIPAVNGVELCFQFVLGGQNVEFCLNLRKSAGAVTSTDLDNAADAGHAWQNSDFLALLSNEIQHVATVATDMSVQGGPQSITTNATNGVISSPSEVASVAGVVSGRTAKRGRSYRGRSYIPGIPTNARLNPTDFTTAKATAIAAAFAALQVDLDAIGFDIVVASRQHNNVVTNPAEQNEVIAFVMDNHYDSQRRRLFGRGT